MYVDGFVLAVPNKNLAAYKKLATKAGKIWMEHGALQYVEAVGDDMNVPMGIPYPQLVKPKKGEVIIFAFITYKSRRHRDAVNKKVMRDDRIHCDDMKKMPFDVSRMSWGGFTSIVNV